VPDNGTVPAETVIKKKSNPNLASGNYYTVKKGDTLWDISKKI